MKYNKYFARKFLITIGLIVTGIVLLCVHLITGAQFVAMISLTTAFYHGHDAYCGNNMPQASTVINQVAEVIPADLQKLKDKLTHD